MEHSSIMHLQLGSISHELWPTASSILSMCSFKLFLASWQPSAGAEANHCWGIGLLSCGPPRLLLGLPDRRAVFFHMLHWSSLRWPIAMRHSLVL